MGCQHMEQVIQTAKIGEAVLKECITVRDIIKHCDIKNKYLKARLCSECLEIDCGNTFMCLQCGFCGCWNKSHFLAHSKKLGHIFGVNSTNGLLFCFRCSDYITDNEMLMTDILPKYWSEIQSKSSMPLASKKDGIMGLVNMGSTCFMSSIIQSFIHNPLMLNYFMNQTHYNSCTIKDSSSCISCAFDRIVTDFFGNVSGNQQQGFIDLLVCSWKINKNLTGYSQQDAHEFWQFLFNQFHLDQMRIDNINSKSIKSNCDCIAHSLYQGYLKSTIICSKCKKNNKTTIDPIMDISLEIKNMTILDECLENFHKWENLTDFDYQCRECNSSNSALRQLSITKLPPVLVFQLKRFEHLINGKSVKLDNYISFSRYLDMKKYYEYESDKEIVHTNYELIGVISHHGTVDQGHYISTCKINDGRWFRFNDSMVTLVNEEDVLKEQAYLLFYIIC